MLLVRPPPLAECSLGDQKLQPDAGATSHHFLQEMRHGQGSKARQRRAQEAEGREEEVSRGADVWGTML